MHDYSIYIIKKSPQHSAAPSSPTLHIDMLHAPLRDRSSSRKIPLHIIYLNYDDEYMYIYIRYIVERVYIVSLKKVVIKYNKKIWSNNNSIVVLLLVRVYKI